MALRPLAQYVQPARGYFALQLRAVTQDLPETLPVRGLLKTVSLAVVKLSYADHLLCIGQELRAGTWLYTGLMQSLQQKQAAKAPWNHDLRERVGTVSSYSSLFHKAGSTAQHKSSLNIQLENQFRSANHAYLKSRRSGCAKAQEKTVWIPDQRCRPSCHRLARSAPCVWFL